MRMPEDRPAVALPDREVGSAAPATMIISSSAIGPESSAESMVSLSSWMSAPSGRTAVMVTVPKKGTSTLSIRAHTQLVRTSFTKLFSGWWNQTVGRPVILGAGAKGD